MALTSGSGYVWLKPATPPRLPRQAQLLLQPPTVGRLKEMLDWLAPQTEAPSEPLHLDFETTGLDTHHPDTKVVGVGLATSRGVAYLDARDAPPEWWAYLVAAVDRCGVVAFNANFDYAFLYRAAGRHVRLVGCSFTAFRLACNEGHFGQRWGLEVAQREVLGWPVTNKSTLGDLLKKYGLAKGEMYKLAELESEAFGRYCAEDADASYQLWEHVLSQGDAGRTTLRRFATAEWATAIQLLVETRHRGVTVNVPLLRAFSEKLATDIAAAEAALRAHPRLAPHIDAREAERAAAFYAPHVTVSRVKCTKAEVEVFVTSGSAPVDWRFESSQAKSLAKWQAAQGGYWYRELRKERPRNEGRQAPRFNFESDPDLRWLLYECVYRAEVRETENAWGRTEKRTTVWVEDGRTVEVGTTDSGLPPVSREILPALGEIGRLVGEFNRLTKLDGYVRAYLEGASADGYLHLGFKPAATLSGRLAGG